MAITRGTTPTLGFELDIDVGLCDKIIVTINQLNENIIQISGDRLEILANTVNVTLTQEETLKLRRNNDVNIQVKVKLVNGTVMASAIQKIDVNNILNEEIL